MHIKTHTLFAQKIAAITMPEAVEHLIKFGAARARGLVVTPNVDHIILLQENNQFAKAYDRAILRLADGMPIIWMSRLLKKPLPERTTGADLLPAIAKEASLQGLTIFLLGAAEGVAETAASNLQALYPGLIVVGTYSPPLGFERDQRECERIIAIVNAAEPDILVIGFGSPKQEIWADQWLERLNVGPILCIGAAIDFAAGKAQRAPAVIQRVGFEWLWRLFLNPRRLWKRYLVRGPRFALISLNELKESIRA